MYDTAPWTTGTLTADLDNFQQVDRQEGKVRRSKRRGQEAKGKEQGASRKEADTSRLEQEAKRKPQESRRKGQEARRLATRTELARLPRHTAGQLSTLSLDQVYIFAS